jgi:hypothetical protein
MRSQRRNKSVRKIKSKNKNRMMSREARLLSLGSESVFVQEPGAIIPNQTECELHFFTSPVITNNGNGYTNNRYVLNQAYDVDPLLGSTTIAGLTEMAAFYGAMRVIGARVVVEFSNNEAFPITVYFCSSLQVGVDPTANTTNGLDYPMNPYTISRALSAKGGQDHCIIKKNLDLSRLLTKQVLTDDNYASGTNGAIAAGYRFYGICGAIAAGTNTFTTAGGVLVSFHVFLRTIFYDRKLLTT